MIDERYITELTKVEAKCIQDELEKFTPNKLIQDLFKLIDCSRRSPIDNRRLIQTIDYPYRLYNAYILFILSNYKVLKEDVVRENWEHIHNNNLEYEKHFPNVVYKKDKPKVKGKSEVKRKSEVKAKLEDERKRNVNARISGLFKFNEMK